jgi:hypothetical protein
LSIIRVGLGHPFEVEATHTTDLYVSNCSKNLRHPSVAKPEHVRHPNSLKYRPQTRGSSHGVWWFESKGVYFTTVQFFHTNADGTPASRKIIRHVIELSPDWTTYTATAAVQVLDVNGNVIATKE